MPRNGLQLLAVLVLWASTAFTPATASAQTLSLSLEGWDGGAGFSTNLVEILPGSGSLAFGSVDTLGLRAPDTGRMFRLAGGGGAFFVATIRALVTLPAGTGSASLDVYRSTLGSLGEARLRYAQGATNTWTSSSAGTSIPTVGSLLLSGDLADGQSLVHQLGVLILDTDVAGIYDTVITYTLTAN